MSFKQKGFTLAEVLITLGIIGVIAALTIPTLVVDVKRKQYEARFQVAQSLLGNAISYLHSKDIQIHGSGFVTANPGYKEAYGRDIFVEVLGQAFTGARDGSEANVIRLMYFGKYYTLNGGGFNPSLLDDGYIELANGMSVFVETGVYSENPIMIVDLNGYLNKPNRLGIDTFAFFVDNNDKVCPLGDSLCPGRPEYTNLDTFCNMNSSSNMNGMACAYKAIKDKSYFDNIDPN